MCYKVSIITPCYNSEKYILRYLKKIKERGFSLIYHKKKNGGLGSAINVGLKLMTGDFFSWCDSDNFYDDNYIEEKVKKFNLNKNCNVVRCDGFLVYEDNLYKPYAKFSDGNNSLYKKDLFINAIIEKNFHFGCIMLRTKAFDTVNPKRKIYESKEGQNWQLILPMFYKYNCYYINKPMFYYVNRKNSITNQSLDGGFKKRLDQQNEHEKILILTINSMNIKCKQYYLYLIKKKYIHRRIQLAKIYNDDNLLIEQNKSLKSLDTNINCFKMVILRLFSYIQISIKFLKR